jgi:hypothetical protein
MMDYVPTRARSKGVVSTPSCGWGQVGAATAKALSISPPPITHGVDKLYRQLLQIHAITEAQLAECAHWRRSDPTPSLIRASTRRQRPDETPYMARTAPPPPID